MIDDGSLSFHRAMCRDSNCQTCLGRPTMSSDLMHAMLFGGGSLGIWSVPSIDRAVSNRPWWDRGDWFDHLVAEMAE